MASGSPKSSQSSRRQGKGYGADYFGKLRAYDLARMAKTKPPRPDYVVRGVALKGETGMVWGAPGLGKSLFTQGACAGVGTGGDVAGFECTQGTSVYVDAENGQWEIHRRVHSVGLDPAAITIFDGQGVHIVDDAADFGALLKATKPDLLVLDSLRSLTPGTDENDSGAMAEVMGVIKGWAQRYQVAVLLIHHARKGRDAFRGSSTIEDQLSVVWEMSADAHDEDVRRLHCEKIRVDEKPADRWVRIQRDGKKVSVVATEKPTGAPVKGTVKLTVTEEVLACCNGVPMTRGEIASALGLEPKESTLSRALRDLRNSGQLERLEDKRYRRGGRVVTPACGGADDLTTDDGGRVGNQVVSDDSLLTTLPTGWSGS